ncbi:cytochrome P450 [Aaosphaeria arxii CBS 175.79]|uniref:Cytochrome P450 n=1 Tax=Aaosphaeria arxii CBS 175.79 TaxID=1450172 RepID=A0A6A5X6V5_9PLEO|nr:cytochrome P450 [Aaosphaeria arxii CBS 175.79]KAF2008616.1 cytochrome P450 [Aaosphaeria arxii CBS 175.79]
MDINTTTLTLLLTILLLPIPTYLIYTRLLHPLYLSPLRRIPLLSPPLSHPVPLPAIHAAHAHHGPIVRLTPTTLSLSSLSAARTIYITRGGFPKPRWWVDQFITYGVANMVSMSGGARDKAHAERKRSHGAVYAKSFLFGPGAAGVERIAGRVLARVRGVLDEVVKREDGGGKMDVYCFNGAASAEFAIGYIYGDGFGGGGKGETDFVGDKGRREEYYGNHGRWLKGEEGAAEAEKWMEGFGTMLREGTERGVEDGRSEGGVVFRQLRSKGIRDDDLSSELLDHFVASAEATRTTLTYLEWEVSKRPSLRERLTEELRSLSRREDTDVPDFKQLDALPLLDAILTETLRVYTPTPGPQHRITPPEGAMLEGYFIPGGVEVSVSLSVLHKNPEVFTRPDVWDPDRWLVDDEEKIAEMRNWFWAFSKGSRICIGKDFALIVLKFIIDAIYSRYETEIVEDDNMQQEDRFLAGPVSEKLVLKFKHLRR